MRRFLFVVVLVVLMIAGILLWNEMHPGPIAPMETAPAKSVDTRPAAINAVTQQIVRGEYLARAGDCSACHTEPTGRLFAGGRAMPTPFGTLYTSNITPDPETGIGKWSADDFYKTMHSGRFPDGGLIYPAMPFASYTK